MRAAPAMQTAALRSGRPAAWLKPLAVRWGKKMDIWLEYEAAQIRVFGDMVLKGQSFPMPRMAWWEVSALLAP